MSYIYLKTLHIIFVISWFAGLFYLPRLFVNHAMVTDSATQAQLSLMEHKLYRFMTLLGVLALGFGCWLWLGYSIKGGWLHAKLVLVLILVAFHLYCGRLIKQFAAGANKHDHKWYRMFNEIPTVTMFIIVFLVVAKPF
ncbi:putative membrane protein [Chitinivorax tropicus]|uniref:Protoporphyrinogen IX oxidase n=1 Tax=Chitinivorax tropicus TaxID=714531 RepID=A0A840MSX8_9PROT|nr:CopD family protein [Chitinivorax tropicus]MBB5019383.1 putative membrane protein [Chitinivorax tropicus]